MSQIVLAAIAYTDARCARHAGYVNQQYAAVTIWWCGGVGSTPTSSAAEPLENGQSQGRLAHQF
jgi:hypothetical protein